MSEELEFRGIEKGKDGIYRAIYVSRNGDRVLLSERQIRSGAFRLKNREGALHALTPTKKAEQSNKD